MRRCDGYVVLPSHDFLHFHFGRLLFFTFLHNMHIHLPPSFLQLCLLSPLPPIHIDGSYWPGMAACFLEKLFPWLFGGDYTLFLMPDIFPLLQWLTRVVRPFRYIELARKMSPETASPVYPDRLIHPLPKRRLRERLSSDAADSIKYPPDQTPGAPLFYYPYSLKQDSAPVERPIFVGQAKAATLAAKAAATTTTTTAVPATTSPNVKQGPATGRAAHLPSRPRRSSGENEATPSSRTTRVVNRSARPSQPLHMPPAQSYWTLPSSTLSVDGFDSFEYTSNTKKRKIPSAGDTSHTGSYSSTSLRSTASESSTTNSSYDSLAGSPPSPADAKPANFVAAPLGISGPGRGRYGRTQRHPITTTGRDILGRHRKLYLPWPGQPGTLDWFQGWTIALHTSCR